MILSEARENIGRRVIYTPYPNCPKYQLERGIITSVNDYFVFVRYGEDSFSKATNAQDLEWEVVL